MIILLLINLISSINLINCFIKSVPLISGAHLIVKKLNEYNISTVFAYTGGANLKLFDALYTSDINVIINRNEQYGGYSAEGYSKSSNLLGVVITTSGPGLTNIITPLQDALSDGIPLLAISAQVSHNKLGTSAFQECNATAITKSCVKYNKLIKSINELEHEIDYAIFTALSNRNGPVHLDICSNVFSEYIQEKRYKIKFSESYDNKYDKSRDYYLINKIYELIKRSEKPILIVGQGCIKDYKEVRKFIKKFNLPTTTTLHGLGILNEDDKNSLKMCGMHGSYHANMAIQNADLIIGIGYRFDDRTIGNHLLYGLNAKKNYGIIHIDSSEIKINEVKAIINPIISLNICTNEFLEVINQKQNKFKNSYNWLNRISNWKKEYNFITKSSMTVPFISQKLSKKINKLNKDYIITTGVGVHQMQVAQYFTWLKPKSIITSGSQGTMGVGLPFALGAQLANPNKIVICIDGDGSFMMSCQDLQTASQYSIPIKILIMDNENLQMVSNWQEQFYNKRFIGSKLTNPNFVKLAESMGIKAIKCDNINQIDETIDEIINSDYPLLVHFKVESIKCLPFVAPNKALDDMILY